MLPEGWKVGAKEYTCPKGREYTRVSTVCDAIGRIQGDGLVYAGAEWAAQKAHEILGTWFVDGVIHPAAIGFKGPVNEWLATPECRAIISGAAKSRQQACADRGTLVDSLWQHMLTADPFMSPSEAVEWCGSELSSWREQSKLDWKTFLQAKEQGLVTDEAKPPRGPQCSIDDVAPYAESLAVWQGTEGLFTPKGLQVFLADDKSLVAGTADGIGEWCGAPAVVDLKTSTNGAPTSGHRAQLAKYHEMFCRVGGIPPSSVRPYVVIVTPKGVSPRALSDQGIKDGLKDFADALAVIRRASMKGSFMTTRATKGGAA